MMTAVLTAADVLRKDRPMSLDNNQINYATSTDWRAKYNEVADMLAETRSELDDFHHASKELEAELENELQRTEKTQQELKVKVIRAESERDEWKSKFMSLQTNHNTTTASLQRELDKLRQDHQQAKIQLRDLEMGNDDLERNERAVSSSLADMEAKYSRALEEKILLEHELLEKANLEEESQRLRDELRDANVEISILKDRVTNSLTSQSNLSSSTDISAPQPHPPISTTSDDDLLSIAPPPDLQLDDLSQSSDNLPLDQSALQTTPKGPTHSGGHSALLQRAGFHPNKSRIATPPSGSRISRSTTLPSLYTTSPRTPSTRLPTKPNSASTSFISGTTSKSKGVQMVSEMRARVRNLEQKIHTRVPRLRMGSITGRSNSNSLALSSLISDGASSSNSSSSKASSGKTSWDGLVPNRRSGGSRQSNDSGSEKNNVESGADSSGWVLIMEDTPSPPPKGREREKRRVSSPSGGPTSFRPAASTSIPSPTFGSTTKSNPLGQSTMTPMSGFRRPPSRLSAGSLSTTTTNSIPTPSSRPATPTYLPLPSSGLYSHPSTAGITGLKRSTGPGTPNPYSQNKRSSLGSSTSIPHIGGGHERSMAHPPFTRPVSGTPFENTKPLETSKALPQLPALHANITMRPPSKKSPSTNGMSLLSQSRIGRPSGGALSGRRSTDGSSSAFCSKLDTRTRSGSVSTPPT